MAAKPRQPKKLSVQLNRPGGGLRIEYAKRDWGSAAFLIFWLCGWTVGCAVLVGVVITQFSFFTLLFALPFWAGELFVLALVSSMIGQHERLSLNEHGATYRCTVWGIPFTRRSVPLAEITSFSGHYKVVEVSDDNGGTQQSSQSQHVLQMHTIGQSLTFCGGIDSDDRLWLANEFNETLANLRRLYVPQSEKAAPLNPADLPPVLELRPPATTQVAPPSDTSWRLHYEFDTITFTQRGHLSASGVGILLFLCVFWNGIVGVFVAGMFGLMPGRNNPHGLEWWGLFFFLIPFELVGLAIMAGLLTALLEPLRRSRWIFARNSIAYRFTYLGLGRRWTYEVRELDRLELRRVLCTVKKAKEEIKDDKVTRNRFKSKGKVADSPEGTLETFTLGFVNKQDAEVCQIADLTLGEACWLADVVLRERTGWFC